MPIDTDSDHVSLHGDIIIVVCYNYLTVYYSSGQAVLIVLSMEEDEEVVRRQFNSLQELEPSYLVGCMKSI